MISLSLDEWEPFVREHVAEHAITWPNARIGAHSEVGADYGVAGLPVYMLVGPDGTVISSGEDAVKAVLESLERE